MKNISVDLFDRDNQLMSDWGYKCTAIVLCLISILGFSFNLFAILMMIKKRKVSLHQPQFTFL